ncbi:vitamin K epoxide reductase family protein [Luteimonas sp. JM171]|uniref:vitamin K epoxide reductase family protein n=1 Tax=Luteimonas sp. JM171 TaxID=1896164 RepID=UPI000A3F4FA5|nr:vitamin K epoxide reductase family protein [Luteimonas sp. JM171]
MARRKHRKPARTRPSQGQAPQAPRAQSRPRSDAWVLALAALGMLLTGYLTLVAWGDGTPALCAEGGDCDAIQGSRWSSFLGLPMALWGFALYALIALAAATGATLAARWRHLSRLTLLGVAVSVYLTIAGLVDVGATCGWCLASLALMAALFALVHLRRPGAPLGQGRWTSWWLGNGLVVIGVVLVLQLVLGDVLDRRPENPRLVALAEHLQATGARYYGASWCGSCARQNRLFGASAERLPYVECSPAGRGGPTARACVEAGVSSYPTWQINGLMHTGVQTPPDLARLSGFDWEGAQARR